MGSQIAVATEPIINPHNLKILGWWCREPNVTQPVVLLTDDVRDINDQGLAVNSEEALTAPEDLVRHKEILAIKFHLLGLPAKTKRTKLGKITDYSYNDGMFIQKLYITPPMVKVFSTHGTRIIDRAQIAEVTDKYILVSDTEITEGAEEFAGAALPAA